jgi:NTE family protein
MTAESASEKSTASGPRIALALGGGSARGLAHIVMLEAFDELGIKPSIIAGTSMGSICGACYAAGLSAAEIRDGFESQFTSAATFFKQFSGKLRGGISTLWSVRSPGIVDNVTLFEMLLPDVLHSDFNSLKIPFLAIAADFYAIEQVILDHGPVIPALAASCALPGMARPVVLEGRVLIDGGYVNPVPYDVVMDRADITVAVDVTGDPQRRPGTRVPGTVEAVTGATQLLFHSITREKLKSIAPDIFIRPKVGGYAALDYFKIGAILDAAQEAKDDLKRQLSQRLEAAS